MPCVHSSVYRAVDTATSKEWWACVYCHQRFTPLPQDTPQEGPKGCTCCRRANLVSCTCHPCPVDCSCHEWPKPDPKPDVFTKEEGKALEKRIIALEQKDSPYRNMNPNLLP
jgi:hypothetical protein